MAAGEAIVPVRKMIAVFQDPIAYLVVDPPPPTKLPSGARVQTHLRRVTVRWTINNGLGVVTREHMSRGVRLVNRMRQTRVGGR